MHRPTLCSHTARRTLGLASLAGVALAFFAAACAPGPGAGWKTAPVHQATSAHNEATPAPNAPADSAQTALQPTLADVAYGPHPRNVLDFWRAGAHGSAPVVVFIHGGGFVSGDKSIARRDPLLRDFLKRGVSFASINYRFLQDAPVQEILRDAARAIQFIRFRADQWQVDKQRIAVYGSSAGAGTALWLAARDDLAEPAHADPVQRESSRVCAAGLFNPQATYDLLRWESFLGPFRQEWLRSPEEMAEFYHLRNRDQLHSPEGERVRRECDMLGWLSPDDPAVFAACSQPDAPPQTRSAYLHHPGHVREIQKHCRAVGIPCVVMLEAAGRDRSAVRAEWRRFAMEALNRR